MRAPAIRLSWKDIGPSLNWRGRVGRKHVIAAGTSLVLHTIVFLGLCSIAFRSEPSAEPTIIPEARLVSAGGAAAPPQPLSLRLAEPPGPAAAQAALPRLQQVAGMAPDLDERLLALARSDPRQPIAAAPSSALPRSPSSAGGRVGVSNPPAGIVAPLTPPAMKPGGPIGPVSRLFGQTGNAYEVVYVVDFSASLMDRLEDIVREMRDSIRALIPTQKFHVILAKPGRTVEEFGPRRLVPGLGRYKAEAMTFLDGIRGNPQPGQTDPIEAMRRAFAVRPELIYFLTDGDYTDIAARLLDELQRLNIHHNVRITTIGFNPSKDPRALLQRIAREHGGHCRIVEAK